MNSTPSSSALFTSLAEPGIFSLSLRYKHFTDLAFCLTAVRTQSIAVSPPPMTTMSLPFASNSPSSNFLTSSPSPFRLDAVKYSNAGIMLLVLSPSLISLAL